MPKVPASDSPFIPVNCAAISGTLFESHMFGHLKGALPVPTTPPSVVFALPTAARSSSTRSANLAAMQAKLLRVLQEGTVVPVGSHEEQPIDVRVVAATNRDLAADVARGLFREDLYYRLAVVSLKTMPLRERPEDIELLADYLLSSQSVKHGMPVQTAFPRGVGETATATIGPAMSARCKTCWNGPPCCPGEH